MTLLAPYTTLRVGGPAHVFHEPSTRDDLVRVMRDAWSEPEDWWLLGGGSNVVIADAGLDGTVVRVATSGIRFQNDGEQVAVSAEAGHDWDALVAETVAQGLGGIEALSGIPGTVGAAPVQNIGAYGTELSDVLVAIDFLDAETGDVERVAAAQLGFGYRTSALKRGRAGVVLGLELALSRGGLSAPIGYAQLADALGVELGSRVPVADARAAVLALRASKGMVLDALDPDSVSAGSFFTNPIVSEGFARSLPADAPRFPLHDETPPRVLPIGAEIPPPVEVAEPMVKLSAAWLIERAGITRGFSFPGSQAAISSKHTLAIVNRGGASATDIIQLADFVQTRVLAEFGIALQPEPTLLP